MLATVTGAVVAGTVLVPYVRGWRRLRAAGGGASGRAGLVLATAGAAVLGLALAPPLEAWAAELFSWHMTQHLALGLFVPLMLVLSRAGEVAPWALDGATRAALRHRLRGWREAARRPSGPLWAGALHLAVWGLWHLPPLYEAAMQHAGVHVLEHASLLGAGLVFWGAATPRLRRVGPAILALFLVSLGSGVLAATLALAPTPFYDVHQQGSLTWDVDPLVDQQLGGLLMWTPAGLVYLGAAVAQLLRWLTHDRAVPLRLATATGAATD